MIECSTKSSTMHLFLTIRGFVGTTFFAIRGKGGLAKLIGKRQVADTCFTAVLIMCHQLVGDSGRPPVLYFKNIPAADRDGEFIFEKLLLDSRRDIAYRHSSLLCLYPTCIAPAIEREAGIFPKLESSIAREEGLTTLCMCCYIILCEIIPMIAIPRRERSIPPFEDLQIGICENAGVVFGPRILHTRVGDQV